MSVTVDGQGWLRPRPYCYSIGGCCSWRLPRYLSRVTLIHELEANESHQGTRFKSLLDYMEVMGELNKMKVAKAGETTNVCLAWEGVNEVKGDKSFCPYLRVVVIATRHIMPFDQLIRLSLRPAIRI